MDFSDFFALFQENTTKITTYYKSKQKMKQQITKIIKGEMCASTKGAYGIGHFLVPKTLTFKMRLGAQPFL